MVASSISPMDCHLGDEAAVSHQRRLYKPATPRSGDLIDSGELTLVCCDAANSTGMVGYDFGAQSAFVSVGADTDVSAKEVQARYSSFSFLSHNQSY